jgi:uncharacterized membrane protein YgcG
MLIFIFSMLIFIFIWSPQLLSPPIPNNVSSLLSMLVSMIMAIVYDTRVFALILCMSLVGFSQALWLLSRHQASLPFGSINLSLLTMFDYMMGNYSLHVEGSVSPSLSTTLVIVFVCTMIILMLNLLIALMGNTFAIVSDKGLAQWHQEQAATILDEKFFLGEAVQVPPCLLVIMHTTDFEKYSEACDDRDRHAAEILRRKCGNDAASGVGTSSGGSSAGGATGGATVGATGGAEEGFVAQEKQVVELTERVVKLEGKMDAIMSKLELVLKKLK